MSAKSGKSSLGLKVVIALVLVVAAAYFIPKAFTPLVEVQSVVSGTAVDAKPGSVTVQPEYSMEIKSEIGGRVLEQNFAVDPGKVVKKGQILVEIDPTDLKLDIDQTETDYKAAKKRVAVGSSVVLELENAKADLENDERLLRFGTMSESDVTRHRRGPWRSPPSTARP